MLTPESRPLTASGGKGALAVDGKSIPGPEAQALRTMLTAVEASSPFNFFISPMTPHEEQHR